MPKKNAIKIKHFFKTVFRFIFNWHFIVCFGLAWFITNGWSYLGLGLGVYFHLAWLISISTAYLAFLWLPLTPEKIITLAIAIWLLRLLFPDDQKTLGLLKEIRENASAKRKARKDTKNAES